MTRRRLKMSACIALLLGGPMPAVALDLPGDGQWRTQVHGFAAQGAAKSWGNNFIGESTDGSFAYYEWGLNATAELGAVSLAAQGILRRVGESDRSGPRLDFGFVDFHPLDTLEYQAGLRYGRVKNPFGLFNDTRDVIFARPSILLPNSVYYDVSAGGIRNFLFSSDGGQAYGAWNVGDHYLSLSVTRALDKDLSQEEIESLFGFSQAGLEVSIDGLTTARIMDEWAGGTWRAAFSLLSANLAYSAGPPFGAGELDYDSYVVSLEHRGERYSVVGEYVVNRFRGTGTDSDTGDGFYVQGDYRLDANWKVMARYDAQYSDRGDRDGSDYAAANPGRDRHERYTHDYVIGASWTPDTQWGVWIEQHFLRGSAAVPDRENGAMPPFTPGTIESNSELLLLMVGYHF